MRVSVQEADFDVGAETQALSAGRSDVGAVATFVGLVRADKLDGDSAAAQAVSAMTLEHYPGMTEKALEEIVAQARERWALLGVSVIHRFGRLLPGESTSGRTVSIATPERRRQLDEMKAKQLSSYDVDRKFGTVGAVALGAGIGATVWGEKAMFARCAFLASIE